MLATELRSILDQMPVPLITLVGGRIELANRHACQILNLTRAQLSGMSFGELFDEPNDDIADFLRFSSRSNSPYLKIFRHQQEDTSNKLRCKGSRLSSPEPGKDAHVLVHITPQEESVSKFVALNEKILALNREIALRRSTEDAMLRHVKMVSFGRDIGLALARSADFQDTMQRCAELMLEFNEAVAVGIWTRQYARAELVLSGFGTSHADKDGSLVNFSGLRPLLERIETSGNSFQFTDIKQERDLDFDGTWFSAEPNSLVAQPLIVDDAIVGVIIALTSGEDSDAFPGSIESISTEIALAIERKRIDVELSKQTEALRVADQRKDEFLAMLAHELRNPLAPIRSGLELLELDLPENDSIEIMKHQVEHMVRLVDDLLDVSRVMRGKIQLQKKPVLLSRILVHAIETVRPTINQRCHDLVTELPATDLWINADEVRMTQVFINLLNNAAKYTANQGRICLNHETKAGEVTVSISDNGIGIERKFIPEMFELFSQSTRTIDRSAGGLGVGLTVVKKLIRLHRGRISVTSDGLGQGSKFQVTLPTVPPPNQQHATPQTSVIGLTHNGKPKRVLVVDDMRGAAVMLKRLVSRNWNHEVELAYDGESACDAARSFQPDVVLLDIGLPGMNGYEVAERLRSQPEFSETKIIAISGYGTEQDRQKSEAAGINLHFAKPVGIDQLAEVFGERNPTED